MLENIQSLWEAFTANEPLFNFTILVIKVFATILFLIVMVAYLTLLERWVLGAIHNRKGPNVVGPFGLFQPFADAFKVLLKETILPSKSNKVVFLLAPIVTFVVATIGWAVIPVSDGMVFANVNLGVLYLMAVSSLGVYGIIMAGWASNSQYAFLGAIRSASQMISYEVSMGLIIMSVILFTGSYNLSDIVNAQQNGWFVLKLFPMAILFFISIVAETNRHPFDLPESEAEIVSGYHVEYSGFAFALFFLGEYANMMLMSAFATTLFLGGWLPLLNFWVFAKIPGFIWFALKVVFLLVIMIQLRGTLPRYRYDQLMRLGWKVFLPLSLGALMLLSVIVKFF